MQLFVSLLACNVVNGPSLTASSSCVCVFVCELENNHPAFCLGAGAAMTNTLKLHSQRHTDGATIEPVCQCLCMCVNMHVYFSSQSWMRPPLAVSLKHIPFLVCRHAPGDNLDSRSKHKSPLGPLTSFLFEPQNVYPFSCWLLSAMKELLSNYSDMLWGFSRDPCKEDHIPKYMDSIHPRSSRLGSK